MSGMNTTHNIHPEGVWGDEDPPKIEFRIM